MTRSRPRRSLPRAVPSRWGWGGADHAARIAPGINGAIAAARTLRHDRTTSCCCITRRLAPGLARCWRLPNPKLLLYHNVTPAEWLWDHAPLVAVHCAARPRTVAGDRALGGRRGSRLGVQRVGAARRSGRAHTQVIPLLLDRRRLGRPVPPRQRAVEHQPTVLFVGRLSPHKRQDEVIRAFSPVPPPPRAPRPACARR